MVVAITETELKYDADQATDLPEMGGLPWVATVSGEDEQILAATYYDTRDLRLARAGITLRRRERAGDVEGTAGAGDAGWHLKLPAGEHSRQELRLPLSQRLPPEFAELVLARTRRKPLRPVARITTVRRTILLADAAGEPLAEVAVDDVTAETTGRSTTLIRWREVEFELAGGGRKLLRAADDLLVDGGLRPSGHASKLARVLADRLPAASAEPELTPRASAGDVVVAYLRAQVEQLLTWDPRVRRDEDDAVHQMRVATRRLRSALQSFATLLRSDDLASLGAELKWLAGVLGAVRDDEVVAARLLADLGRIPPELVLGPVRARIAGHYSTKEFADREELLAAMNSDRYLALLDELDRLLADPPLTDAADRRSAKVMPKLVKLGHRRVRRRMVRASNVPRSARDEALHDARKAAKRARYTAEAVGPALGRKTRKVAKRMSKLQTVLGEHHDTVAAREAIRELAIRTHLDGENAFTFGLLHERDRARAKHLMVRIDDAWAKLR